MAIKISEDRMTLEIGGAVVSTATGHAGGWWEVTYWPRFFDRNQAITALTVTELPEAGYANDDLVIASLREEFR